MILDDIVRDKRNSLSAVKVGTSLELQMERAMSAPRARDFRTPLTRDAINVIAEVKRASPSKGMIRQDFDPLSLALDYEVGGAAAVSVLTEEKYFLGSLTYIETIKDAVRLPVLRKDFIFDEYQVYESRANGADALLLITAILDDATLKELLSLTERLGMTALVEVHDEAELERALLVGAGVIGINNRDLRTFKTDVSVTKRLMPLIPDDVVVVSESGISTRSDIDGLKSAGVDAFLIGEALSKEAAPSRKLAELVGR
jgi:indole-3-glycerol phosphate synthase